MDKQLELTGISRVRRRLSTEASVEVEVVRENEGDVTLITMTGGGGGGGGEKPELTCWFPMGLNPPCSGMWNIRWRHGRYRAYFSAREWYELNKGWRLSQQHAAMTTGTLEWQGLAHPPVQDPKAPRARNVLIG